MSTYAKFYALLNKMPYVTKADLILQYSKNKTDSLRTFYNKYRSDYDLMLQGMQNAVENTEETTSLKIDADDLKKRRLRSLILRAMQDQGVMVKDRDWSAVNNFVSKHAGEGKSLSNMSLEELTTFNKQVHKLLDWYRVKKEKQRLIALQN